MATDKPTIFLDRDGTLIEEVHYLSDLARMVLFPGAARAVHLANQAGFPVVIVTNQSGVARGYFSEAFIEESAAHLQMLLARDNAHFDGHYHCPFHPQGHPPYNHESEDRKPGPGMLMKAESQLGKDKGVKINGAYMIGDKSADLETGAELGVVPILVRTGYGIETEKNLPLDFYQRGGQVFADLKTAVHWIMERHFKD